MKWMPDFGFDRARWWAKPFIAVMVGLWVALIPVLITACIVAAVIEVTFYKRNP